ncbi:MAG: clostripain-related cysteine peptidase [Chloroflexota bacterium]
MYSLYRSSFLALLVLTLLALPVTNPAAGQAAGQQTFQGSINNLTPFVEYPFTVDQDGSTIVLDIVPTGDNVGQLDTYLYLVDANGSIIAENDDRVRGDLSSRIEYPLAEAGQYTAIATRYGVVEGASYGTFTLMLDIQPPSPDAAPVFDVSPEALAAAGYPAIQPQPPAQWTILAYYGGDNTLEYSLQNDFNEFEMAGGSTENVRIIVALDRHPELSIDNGDWRTMRIYEVAPDITQDETLRFPPTIDTMQPIADLGMTDTGSGEHLAQFLVWGIRNYPAQRYAISLGSHGAGWKGIVTDDTAALDNPRIGSTIVTIPELEQAFTLAQQAAGVDKFDLLINDACSMSSIEYFTGTARFFNLSLASPEIVVDPALNMTQLVNRLQSELTAVDTAALSISLVDRYIDQDMLLAGDQNAVYYTHAVTDLNAFDPVTQAVENFARLVNSDIEQYARAIGAARTNTYTYTGFAGENEKIDLGSFMLRVQAESTDVELIDAAQQVIDAMEAATVYKRGGGSVPANLSYYNIFFPPSSAEFSVNYFTESPLTQWGRMLRNYYNTVTPQVWAGGQSGPAFHPPTAPKGELTRIYPQDTGSVVSPFAIRFELVSRNVSFGTATFDQLQPDGTAIRLGTDSVLTTTIDETTDEPALLNIFFDGVDIRDFFWDAALPVVSDGRTSANELVGVTEDAAFLEGLYREPGSEQFNQVSVIFDNALNNADGIGRVQRVINQSAGTSALGVVSIPPGSEFIAYRSIVTADGRVETQAGTTYTWPEGGLTYSFEPAPSGQYNIGILMEAFGGTTGFTSRQVTVNNDGIDPSLRADTRLNEGFTLTRPKTWSFLTIVQPEGADRPAFGTISPDGASNITAYIAVMATAEDSLEAIVDEVFTFYFPDQTWDRQYTETTIGGRPALEFSFTYPTSQGTFTARAFAVYNPETGFGFVFSSEGLNDPANVEALYQQMAANVQFFDPAALEAENTSRWDFSYFEGQGRMPFTPEVEYPIPRTWQAVPSGQWTRYAPGGDAASTTFIAFSTLPTPNVAAALDLIIAQNVLQNMEGFSVTSERTLIGENATWTARLYNVTRAGQTFVGRAYATIANGQAYVAWMETPESGETANLYATLFEPMIDGFIINAPEAEQ